MAFVCVWLTSEKLAARHPVIADIRLAGDVKLVIMTYVILYEIGHAGAINAVLSRIRVTVACTRPSITLVGLTTTTTMSTRRDGPFSTAPGL